MEQIAAHAKNRTVVSSVAINNTKSEITRALLFRTSPLNAGQTKPRSVKNTTAKSALPTTSILSNKVVEETSGLSTPKSIASDTEVEVEATGRVILYFCYFMSAVAVKCLSKFFKEYSYKSSQSHTKFLQTFEPLYLLNILCYIVGKNL
jgi:hypothetical protein